MSAPILDTRLSVEDEGFRANAAHNRALVEGLRAKVAQAALGGDEPSRQKHLARGKLLPRDRVEHVLDPGSPFLAAKTHPRLRTPFLSPTFATIGTIFL